MNEATANIVTAPTIVLDPGHGGTEQANGSQANNAVGSNGLLEKDLTFTIAQAAAKILRSAQHQVVLTREDDSNLPLAARTAVAREHNASIFVSIHLNGHTDTNIDGTEVYIAPNASETTRRLAGQLLQSCALTTRVAPRGIKTADFTVIDPANHQPQTAACLIELAFLTNPSQAQRLTAAPYVQQLGLALAQGIMGFSAAQPVGQGLALNSSGERLVYNTTRDHRDPPNFLPEPDRGQDIHTFTIPDGLRFSRWEVEIENTSPGSGYRVVSGPQKGADGQQRVTVEWWFGAYGRITYRLRAFASPDGRSRSVSIIEGQSGWTDHVRDQMQQGLPVSLGVQGPQALALKNAITRHPEARSAGIPSHSLDFGVVSGPVAIAVIAAIVIGLGMMVFGALMKQAMDQGYDVRDTRYVGKTGSGENRQEHTLWFNLRPPGTTEKEESVTPSEISMPPAPQTNAGAPANGA